MPFGTVAPSVYRRTEALAYGSKQSSHSWDSALSANRVYENPAVSLCPLSCMMFPRKQRVIGRPRGRPPTDVCTPVCGQSTTLSCTPRFATQFAVSCDTSNHDACSLFVFWLSACQTRSVRNQFWLKPTAAPCAHGPAQTEGIVAGGS